VQVVAAWFSVGYHHPDEHFQVLEFSNHRLGLSPAADLPWEFAARIRPALQPFVAYCLSVFLQKAGVYNPFTVAFILRLVMGILTWWVVCRVVALLLPELKTSAGKKAFVWCSFLLWFVPYIGVRFSAENIAGLLFMLALTVVLPLDKHTNRRAGHFFIAGVLLGISLFIRVQMVFALAAFVVWALYYRKWAISGWVLAAAGGLAAVGICVCIDRWFYGAWLFSPYNYFHANVVEHIASRYGVYPVWYYFTEFINIAVPPISLALLPLFFYGMWLKKNHPFSWISTVFILGHCMPAHKEFRFLFPMMLPFIFFACAGFDVFISKYADRPSGLPRWLRASVRVFIALNCILLAIKAFSPAYEPISYLEAVYRYAKNEKIILVADDKSPYRLNELEINFYKSPNVELKMIGRPGELASVIESSSGRPVLFLSKMFTADPLIKGCNTRRVFCLIPGWMSYFNFADWESRSYIWVLYRVSE
jgi:GPI mannosyltransferase 3